MKIRWITQLAVTPTLGPWAHRNHGQTNQQRQVNDFIQTNSVSSHYIGAKCPDQDYEMISLRIDGHSLIDIDHVDQELEKCVGRATRFLHLCVNKFLIYSSRPRQEYTDTEDLDLRLVRHWSDIVNRPMVLCMYNSKDQGHYGNWLYPLTNLVWNING